MNLAPRLSLLGWTSESTARIRGFNPTFKSHVDRIIRRLYDHLLARPESARLLVGKDVHGTLAPAQREHWLRLFRCEFDDDYVRDALRIGQVHYRQQVPPYIYMAAYNYFLTSTLAVSVEAVRGLDLPYLLTDISRLVSLDLELSLSSYVRQHWGDEDTVLVT